MDRFFRIIDCVAKANFTGCHRMNWVAVPTPSLRQQIEAFFIGTPYRPRWHKGLPQSSERSASTTKSKDATKASQHFLAASLIHLMYILAALIFIPAVFGQGKCSSTTSASTIQILSNTFFRPSLMGRRSNTCTSGEPAKYLS